MTSTKSIMRKIAHPSSPSSLLVLSGDDWIPAPEEPTDPFALLMVVEGDGTGSSAKLISTLSSLK